MASGPETDLPGTHLLSLPGEDDAEGILINWIHFGESDIECQARYGRTLTHKMGHYLSLLHTWGSGNCELNDYCNDTPAVDVTVFGRNSFEGCSGEFVMISNYMNYSDDEIMNIFTNNQVDRMHYVLNNHMGRNSLMSSPALEQ
ncbi:M43 family zinc metalloprotease [Reichenbachiella sp. MALMAid0571]|uniref:M43 family zinc metalloprotease n=1 Tax=Reichenbachiella sp. MALMAid0571 TaxID=3143939 RepID=UPI0032DE6B32